MAEPKPGELFGDIGRRKKRIGPDNDERGEELVRQEKLGERRAEMIHKLILIQNIPGFYSIKRLLLSTRDFNEASINLFEKWYKGELTLSEIEQLIIKSKNTRPPSLIKQGENFERSTDRELPDAELLQILKSYLDLGKEYPIKK